MRDIISGQSLTVCYCNFILRALSVPRISRRSIFFSLYITGLAVDGIAITT